MLPTPAMINLVWLAAFFFVIGVVLMLPALCDAGEGAGQSPEENSVWRNQSAERLDVVCIWKDAQQR
jgi:hypothetical protein